MGTVKTIAGMLSRSPRFGGFTVFKHSANAVQGYSYGGEIGYHSNMRNSTAPYAEMLQVEDIGYLFSYSNMQHVSLKGVSGTQNVTGNIYAAAVSVDMSISKRRKR